MGSASAVDEDFLEHFGIKGMHWGVRRKNPSGSEKIRVDAKAGRKVTATGGSRHAPSKDAIETAKNKQRAKKSTTDALSTQQLQQLVKRMQLEQQYAELKAKEPNKFKQGQNTVKDILSVAKTVNDVYNTINSPLGKQIQNEIAKGLKGLKNK